MITSKKRIYFLIIFLVLLLVIVGASFFFFKGYNKSNQFNQGFSLSGPIDYAKYEQAGLDQEKVDILFTRLKDFDQKIQANADYDDMMAYAGFLKILKENHESLAAFEKARDKFPELGPAYAEIANLYIYPFGRYDEAVDLLKTAIEKAPYKSDYYRTLADLYIAKFPADKVKIEPLMLSGAEETPENALNFYNYLITFFEREGNYSKAVYYTKKCIELSPNDETLKNALIQLQAELNKRS